MDPCDACGALRVFEVMHAVLQNRCAPSVPARGRAFARHASAERWPAPQGAGEVGLPRLAPARRRWGSPRRKRSKVCQIGYGVIAEVRRACLCLRGFPFQRCLFEGLYLRALADLDRPLADRNCVLRNRTSGLMQRTPANPALAQRLSSPDRSPSKSKSGHLFH